MVDQDIVCVVDRGTDCICKVFIAVGLTLMVTDMVHVGPGEPGKSWNFILTFSRTGMY